jgi:hypothetical protein
MLCDYLMIFFNKLWFWYFENLSIEEPLVSSFLNFQTLKFLMRQVMFFARKQPDISNNSLVSRTFSFDMSTMAT